MRLPRLAHAIALSLLAAAPALPVAATRAGDVGTTLPGGGTSASAQVRVLADPKASTTFAAGSPVVGSLHVSLDARGDGVSLDAQQEGRLRFYTPNIIAAGATGSPARDTTADQIAVLFTDEADIAPVLRSVDVYGFFGASVGRADATFDAMLQRAIPMLRSHGVKLGLEVGGPLGYAPPTVYGGDAGGQNGIKSAEFDLGPTRIGKIERLGGTVEYLMLDGALRRTIRNGEHDSPHAAYVKIGTGNTGLRFTALEAGFGGNSIRVRYVVAGRNTPLSVTVSGNDITVNVATDDAGAAMSTASQVSAAVEASDQASALVTVVTPADDDGSGVISAVEFTHLAYGDDGLNMTIAQSCAELIEYIRTIHVARPSIRFVLIEDTILWPYEGVAGYQSVSYPIRQRPDFHDVWEELISQLEDAGLRSLLVGMHNDHPVEYPETLLPSINKDADDWYGRTLRLQAQVEADGVAFAQLFNSLWGGDPAQDGNHPAPFASDRYFQAQVLGHIENLESYRLVERPDLGQSRDFAFDAFMYHPRVVTPSSTEYSTDDTYLEALALYDRLGRDASSAATISPPQAAFRAGVTSGRNRIPLRVRWAAIDLDGSFERIELQRSVDGGSWTSVTLRSAAPGSARLEFAFGRRYQLRVRATDASGARGAWIVGPAFVPVAYDPSDPAVVHAGDWRIVTTTTAVGGDYARSRERGADAQLSFVGRQVAWIGQRGPKHGRADVYVDGVKAGRVELGTDGLSRRRVLYVSPPVDESVATAMRTVELRNVSSPVRRIVDLDAFIVLDTVD